MSRQAATSMPMAKVIPPPQPPKAVDLTSSLLQSNLTQLSKPQSSLNTNLPPNSNSMTYQMSTNNFMSASPIGKMGALNTMGSQIGNTLSSPTGNTMNSPVGNTIGAMGNLNSPMSSMTYGFQNQLALPPGTGWNNTAPNGNFNNKWANQTNIKQDWSAFESLLPNSNENKSNNDKKFSNNEMMDLLG